MISLKSSVFDLNQHMHIFRNVSLHMPVVLYFYAMELSVQVYPRYPIISGSLGVMSSKFATRECKHFRGDRQ